MTGQYDHAAARANMSPEEIEDIRITGQKQYRQAINGTPINCAGIDCLRKRRLINMFRCWFCGCYFCPVCAREHFGDRGDNNGKDSSSSHGRTHSRWMSRHLKEKQY